jgi:hypothetical protein
MAEESVHLMVKKQREIERHWVPIAPFKGTLLVI